MSQKGWLTPDTIPATTRCRALFIPDDEAWIAIVTGALLLLTYPENWEEFGDLTPQEAADAFLPMFNDFRYNRGVCRVVGEFVPFAGDTNPDTDHWLLCDGSDLLQVDYPDLFAVIGFAYTAGTDPIFFTIPDFRRTVPIGADPGGSPAIALGQYIGEETHTLTVPEMPAHGHTDAGHTHAEGIAGPNVTTIGAGAPQPTAVPAVGVTGTGYASILDTGGDGAHNNVQPSVGINWYIVAKG